MGKFLTLGKWALWVLLITHTSSNAILTESDLPPAPTSLQAKDCQSLNKNPNNIICQILEDFPKLTKEQQCLIDSTHRMLICQARAVAPTPLLEDVWIKSCIEGISGPFAHCSS